MIEAEHSPTTASTETGEGKGAGGSSWIESGDGVGDLDGPYKVVELPEGMTEQEFMAAIEGSPAWNNWLYFPVVNDCHADLERAFERTSVPYPGAPSGRWQIDDVVRDRWDRFMRALGEVQRRPWLLYRAFSF